MKETESVYQGLQSSGLDTSGNLVAPEPERVDPASIALLQPHLKRMSPERQPTVC